MKKLSKINPKLLAFGIVFAYCFFFNGGKAFAFSGSGNGTSGDPYQITTCAQLQSMDDSTTSYYELVQDIDCTGASTLNGTGFSPVGASGGFSGNLDGQNHSITNLDLSFYDDSTTYGGLFSYLVGTATIKDIKVFGKINGGSNIGMIAGDAYQNTQLTNIYVNADVSCHGIKCGGLVGNLRGNAQIINSGADVFIVSDSDIVGGLAAYMEGDTSIEQSYANGYISGATDVGGLVGNISTDISSPVTITNTFSGATVIASDLGAGGLIGHAEYANLTNSYASGSVTGDGYVGGIAGVFSGMMAEVFAATEIHGSGGTVGPVTGHFGTGSVGNRYFDIERTGLNYSPDGSSGITPSEYFLDNHTNPPMNNWDFSTIWRTNYNGYPSFAPKIDPYMLCEQASVTNTTIHIHCFVAPLGWGTPTWELRYRKKGTSSWKTYNLSDIHQDLATIAGLTPGTDYETNFRFTNDWGTGPWGSIEATTTGTAPSEGGKGAGDSNESISDVIYSASSSLIVASNLDGSTDSSSPVSAGSESSEPANQNILEPKTVKDGDNTLKIVLIASGVIISMIILFNFVKPPSATPGK